MPKVTKIRKPVKKSAPSPATSILGKARPVKIEHNGIKLVVYGRSKTGKTRLASTFKKPLLMIGTEYGVRSLGNVASMDFLKIESIDDYDEIVAALPTSKYASVAVDTGGGIQDLVMKDVLGLDEIPLQRSWGIAEQRDWATIAVQTKERFRNLLNLAQFNKINVIIVAHERNFGDETSTELLAPTVGAALTPSVCGWLNGECDYIAQAFIRTKTIRKQTTIAGKKTEMSVPTDQSEYCLRIGPHAIYTTGFRVSPGVVLPDVIVDPTYDKLVKLMG